MKKLLLCVVLCAIPVAAFAHPGKTDKYGGHECLKGCEDWKLYYKEYHLHDKDGKPIRIAKKTKKKIANVVISEPTVTAAFVSIEPPVTAQTVTVYQYITTVSEEGRFNPLLWILLIMLLLLLIVRLSRKQTDRNR